VSIPGIGRLRCVAGTRWRIALKFPGARGQGGYGKADLEGKDLGWHVIPGSLFLASLRRVEEGEPADLVFAELWANADHESYRTRRHHE